MHTHTHISYVYAKTHVFQEANAHTFSIQKGHISNTQPRCNDIGYNITYNKLRIYIYIYLIYKCIICISTPLKLIDQFRWIGLLSPCRSPCCWWPGCCLSALEAPKDTKNRKPWGHHVFFVHGWSTYPHVRYPHEEIRP